MGLMAKVLVTLGVASGEKFISDKTIYDFVVTGNNGTEVALSQYRGKVVLIVNVASQCGFTPQYKGLQALYDKYKEQGFVILGFPSNQFGGQEPGSDEEIKKFCELNFGVNFPLFKKGDVKGDGVQPLFRYLTTEANGAFTGDVMWNFEKFLIDKNGHLVERYRSITKPESSNLNEKILSLLPQQAGG